jgi:hypothetical protein
MKKLIIYSFAFLMLSAAASSCSKYEEGPKLAFSSKKSRLVGEWKLTKQTENGTDNNLTNVTTTLSIKDDATFYYKIAYSVLGIPVSFDSEGKWAFNDDKTQVLFTEDGQTSITNQTIVKLASDELKLREIDGNDTIVSTYQPQ